MVSVCGGVWTKRFTLRCYLENRGWWLINRFAVMVAAGKRILEEEGGMRLTSSSTYVALRAVLFQMLLISI
jgi:hypothetical protein